MTLVDFPFDLRRSLVQDFDPHIKEYQYNTSSSAYKVKLKSGFGKTDSKNKVERQVALLTLLELLDAHGLGLYTNVSLRRGNTDVWVCYRRASEPRNALHDML